MNIVRLLLISIEKLEKVHLKMIDWLEQYVNMIIVTLLEWLQ